MKIAVISDFHLSPRPWMDSFGHEEDEFISFIQRLEAEHQQIVLLGDIYQTDHATLPSTTTAQRDLELARRRYPGLVEKIEGPHFHYVVGNHDAIAASVLGALPYRRLEHDGLAMVFIHGHQFDPLLNNIRPITNLSTKLMGRLRYFGLRRVAEWFEEKDVVLKEERYGGPEGPYALAARHLMRRHRAELVCMAHTHCPTQIYLPEGRLLNSGACRLGRSDYITIDTTSRRAQVVTRDAPRK